MDDSDLRAGPVNRCVRPSVVHSATSTSTPLTFVSRHCPPHHSPRKRMLPRLTRNQVGWEDTQGNGPMIPMISHELRRRPGGEGTQARAY